MNRKYDHIPEKAKPKNILIDKFIEHGGKQKLRDFRGAYLALEMSETEVNVDGDFTVNNQTLENTITGSLNVSDITTTSISSSIGQFDTIFANEEYIYNREVIQLERVTDDVIIGDTLTVSGVSDFLGNINFYDDISGSGDIYCDDLYTTGSSVHIGNTNITSNGIGSNLNFNYGEASFDGGLKSSDIFSTKGIGSLYSHFNFRGRFKNTSWEDFEYTRYYNTIPIEGRVNAQPDLDNFNQSFVVSRSNNSVVLINEYTDPQIITPTGIESLSNPAVPAPHYDGANYEGRVFYNVEDSGLLGLWMAYKPDIYDTGSSWSFGPIRLGTYIEQTRAIYRKDAGTSGKIYIAYKIDNDLGLSIFDIDSSSWSHKTITDTNMYSDFFSFDVTTDGSLLGFSYIREIVDGMELVLTTSTDDGVSFNSPIVVDSGSYSPYIDITSYNALSIYDSNDILIVYRRLSDPALVNNNYDVLFAKTTDGGSSWEKGIVAEGLGITSYLLNNLNRRYDGFTKTFYKDHIRFVTYYDGYIYLCDSETGGRTWHVHSVGLNRESNQLFYPVMTAYWGFHPYPNDVIFYDYTKIVSADFWMFYLNHAEVFSSGGQARLGNVKITNMYPGNIYSNNIYNAGEIKSKDAVLSNLTVKDLLVQGKSNAKNNYPSPSIDSLGAFGIQGSSFKDKSRFETNECKIIEVDDKGSAEQTYPRQYCQIRAVNENIVFSTYTWVDTTASPDEYYLKFGRTFDGGYTWNGSIFPLTPSWSDLSLDDGTYKFRPSQGFRLAVEDEDNVYVIYNTRQTSSPYGRKLYFIKTTDGGSSWSSPTEILSNAADFYSTAYVETNKVFILVHYDSYLRLLKTTDGGSNWNTVNIIDDEELVIPYYMYRRSSDGLLAIIGSKKGNGYRYSIAISSDDGDTWTWYDTNVGSVGYPVSLYYSENINAWYLFYTKTGHSELRYAYTDDLNNDWEMPEFIERYALECKDIEEDWGSTSYYAISGIIQEYTYENYRGDTIVVFVLPIKTRKGNGEIRSLELLKLEFDISYSELIGYDYDLYPLTSYRFESDIDLINGDNYFVAAIKAGKVIIGKNDPYTILNNKVAIGDLSYIDRYDSDQGFIGPTIVNISSNVDDLYGTKGLFIRLDSDNTITGSPNDTDKCIETELNSYRRNGIGVDSTIRTSRDDYHNHVSAIKSRAIAFTSSILNVKELLGLDVELGWAGGITTISGMYGIRVNSDNVAFGNASFDNIYGLYIDDFSAPPGATFNNSYNIYSAGSGTKNKFEGDLDLDGEFVLNSPTVPASGTAVGETGQISWDPNYIYVCVSGGDAGNAVWRRSLHSGF